MRNIPYRTRIQAIPEATENPCALNIPIRSLTVDDHPLLRVGIGALVNAECDMKLVAEVSNGQDAIEQFRLHRPDVTLMDLQMPTTDGIEGDIGIRAGCPDARIILLTTHTCDVHVLLAENRCTGLHY